MNVTQHSIGTHLSLEHITRTYHQNIPLVNISPEHNTYTYSQNTLLSYTRIMCTWLHVYTMKKATRVMHTCLVIQLFH